MKAPFKSLAPQSPRKERPSLGVKPMKSAKSPLKRRK